MPEADGCALDDRGAPEVYPRSAATGAYMMNVHYEACSHLHRTVAAIKETGMKAGVTLNPHTPYAYWKILSKMWTWFY